MKKIVIIASALVAVALIVTFGPFFKKETAGIPSFGKMPMIGKGRIFIQVELKGDKLKSVNIMKPIQLVLYQPIFKHPIYDWNFA